MSSKDSKPESAADSAKKTAAKKTAAKKPEAKKPAEKAFTFQGREVEIVAVAKSSKGPDRDLLDLKFSGEDVVFRIKRRALDK